MATIIEWTEAHYDIRTLQDWPTLLVWADQFAPQDWVDGTDPAKTILIPWLEEHCQGRIIPRGCWMEIGRDERRTEKVYFLLVEDPMDVLNIKLRWC
jgi:hypothetical protein